MATPTSARAITGASVDPVTDKGQFGAVVCGRLYFFHDTDLVLRQQRRMKRINPQVLGGLFSRTPVVARQHFDAFDSDFPQP